MLEMYYLISFVYPMFYSLLFSIIIECFTCIPFYVLSYLESKDFKYIVIASLLTNPVVCFITLNCLYTFELDKTAINFLVISLEILVVIVEGLYLRRKITMGNKSFLLSLLINFISFSFSFIL